MIEKQFSVGMKNDVVVIEEKKIKKSKNKKWIFIQCYVDVCHQKINFKNKKNNIYNVIWLKNDKNKK